MNCLSDGYLVLHYYNDPMDDRKVVTGLCIVHLSEVSAIIPDTRGGSLLLLKNNREIPVKETTEVLKTLILEALRRASKPEDE